MQSRFQQIVGLTDEISLFSIIIRIEAVTVV